jgi:hypothetical protein
LNAAAGSCKLLQRLRQRVAGTLIIFVCRRARSQRLLHDLCNLPALEDKSAIRACALEILSSRSAPLSAHVPPLQQRVHRIQAACVLCAVKLYPLQLLAQEMQAGWAEDSAHSAQVSSLRLQVSLMCAFLNVCIVL